MRILILGSTGYHPNERRHTSCVMLPELGVVFDAGTAVFRILEHLETRDVDIFLSHAHLDHVVGLTYLMNIKRRSHVERMFIRGEAEKLEAIKRHLFAELIFPVAPSADMVPLEEGPLSLRDGAQLSYFNLDGHPGGTVGYRVDQGGVSCAYVPDTQVLEQPSYLEAIRGVDLLIHECNFRDGCEAIAASSGHSCTSQVAALAARAGVGRLLLTHFDASDDTEDPVGLETARGIFANTDLAEDGLEVVVG